MTDDKSRVVILSGFYPTPVTETGGDFALIRYEELINQGISADLCSYITIYSKCVKRLYFYLTNKSIVDFDNYPLPQPFNEIRIKAGLLSVLLSRIIIPRVYYSILADIIWKNIDTQAQIIHAHWVYPHGYIATLVAKKHNIPCVVTAHGSDIHTIPRKNHIIKKYTLKTLNSADKVIFVSQALLESAKELGYSGENAVVIPNGIDMEYFYPMEKEEALKRTGWKQAKRHVIGFVGNLIPVKRADKFVAIFSEIQKQVQDVEFILVGDGDLRDDIRSGVADAGLTVTFAGRVPHEDVCCWMNLFDVMILPSRNESWGCVVQEAYACGVPVVGAAVGGIPENLGGLCQSVADGDRFEKRFADAVCDVLTGEFSVDKERLIARAGEYTWETCVEKEIEVYREMIQSYYKKDD